MKHHKPVSFRYKTALLIRNETLGPLHQALEDILAFSTMKQKLSLPIYICKTATDTALLPRNNCKAHTSALIFYTGWDFYTCNNLAKYTEQLEHSMQVVESERTRRECTAFKLTFTYWSISVACWSDITAAITQKNRKSKRLI